MTATSEQEYAQESTDPHCLTPAEADTLLRGSPWVRFAVLGDSIAEGLGDPVPGYQDLGWADRLAAALQRQHPDDFSCLRLGKRDLRTAEVLQTQLGPALDFRPDLVMLVTGGNDLLRKRFDGDAVQADYDALVGALRDSGAEVMTASMFDITRSSIVPEEYKAQLRERLSDLADRIRAVADARGTLHVDFATHPAAGDDSIYSADVRHANRRGHAIAAAGAIRRLGERLGNHAAV
jgi:lysophospholipase L1-like esterase